MDLERLAAAVGAVDVVGRAPVEVRDLAYDARAVAPGSLFFCVPRRACRRARLRRRGGRGAARSRSSSSARSTLAGAAGRRAPTRAPRWRPRPTTFFGRPDATSSQVAGVTGTNGKTTTTFLLFAILAAAGRRPGLVGTIEARVGGERRGVKRTTPEAIDLQRLFREMLDAGDRSRRDGGVVARVGAAPPRPRALRGARLHEPQPRAPRLPRGHGGLLPGEAAALRRRARRRPP